MGSKPYKHDAPPADSPLDVGSKHIKLNCRQYPGGRFKTIYTKCSTKADSSLEVGSETKINRLHHNLTSLKLVLNLIKSLYSRADRPLEEGLGTIKQDAFPAVSPLIAGSEQVKSSCTPYRQSTGGRFETI